MISKKVNVPRVSAFKAAAIVTQDSEPTVGVTKKIGNIGAAACWDSNCAIRLSVLDS